MATFGAKLEHLLSSRAEIISRMHRPPPAEGNDLERLLGLPPNAGPAAQAPLPSVPIWPDEQSATFCAVTPPIETFMDVPDDIRRDQFFATARRDDVLVGVINVIQDSGLVINLLAYDQGPRRDFEGLKITGFCPTRQIPRYNAHGNVLDAFQIGDKVRVFILDVHGAGRLILSMNPKALNRDLYGDLKLGIITDDDMPLHFKKLQNLDGKSYEAYLESTPQFRNPDGLQVLCARMGIPRSSACSLLMCINKIRLPKSEMGCELRRAQLQTFSMKHVAQGVKYFKESRNTEALQCYNFAIEVEPTNPDAYVARGALYASIGTYTKAVDDLEKSLELQPNHVNAKNYLGQTLVAYAGELTRKDPGKAEQLLNRALKLDPDNTEAHDALKELQASGTIPANNNKDSSLRSWSRSPSPRASSRSQMGSRRDRSSVSPANPSRQSGPGGRDGAGYVSHIERSRAALEQLVEEDRSRRAAAVTKDSGRQADVSPPGFYSPNRSNDRRRNDYSRDDMKSGAAGAGSDKAHMDRGDLSKIVITRSRSGRIIRCKDDDDMGDEPSRGDNCWKRPYDDDSRGRDRGRGREEPEIPNTRRVFTPPRNAREGEHGSLTVYENENDLPMTSKSLQERVQARLRAIERRHQIEEGNNPVPVDAVNGAPQEKAREGSFPNEDYPPNESPRGAQGHWRGSGAGGSSFERRSSSSFNRPDHFGSRNSGGGGSGYFGRGRPRGGPRWRGQWDDYRGRRGNWGHRYDDRRRDSGPRGSGGGGDGGGGGQGSSFDRRRRRFVKSGSADRSPRSSRSRSKSRSRSRPSRSRSRSFSRSAPSSSPSPSPVRPPNRMRVISRARIKTPPLAPLVTSVKRSDSDENLAELDQFVAQLKAKRQLQQQYQQQQQYMTQYQEMQASYMTGAQSQEANPVTTESREIGPQLMMKTYQNHHNDDSQEDRNEAAPSGYQQQQQQHYQGSGDDHDMTGQDGPSNDPVDDPASPEAPQAASPSDQSMDDEAGLPTELTAS